MEIDETPTLTGEDKTVGEVGTEPEKDTDYLPKPNTDDDSDDSHSHSDSDSEDESLQKEELKTLESELSLNPSNYESHVQYIKLLRKMGEIEKLREARESMSAVFPLTPAMWMDWARDEASLSSGPDSFSLVERLYERGLHDYLSVSLWCEYLNYVQEYDPSVRECSPDGISKARDLFERAITAAGLHITEGNRIWETYREFEQAILLTIDETDSKAKELQVQRIRSIFHRHLSIPLHNMRSTLLVYKAWEVEQGQAINAESDDVDGIASHVASAYQKAMDAYNARFEHEEQISRKGISDAEKFQNYMNYVKFEKSAGDPVRVQVLYERAITDFPVSNDLWLDYTCYLDRTLKVGSVVRDVHSRATRNCPWVGELWIRYLLSLERGRASEKDISAVFERSLQCTFSTLEEYLDLFLTRIDGLRRQMVSGSLAEGLLDYSLIRETFQSASDYLSPQMKNTDGLLRLHAYWSQLEQSLARDIVAARGVWENLLKISGSMLEAWQGYIKMEVELGNILEARSIYKRCYSKRFSGTGSEDICRSWLRFEREFGTLEDFDHAVLKVTPRLEELQLFKVQQESKTLAGLADQREISAMKSSREKRKLGPNNSDEPSPAKRQKQAAQSPKKEHNNYENVIQNQLDSAKEGKSAVERTEKTHSKEVKDSSGLKAKSYTDQCTAFISNLNPKAKYEDLEKFLSDVGGVVSIRILHDKFTGKSRGLAYVDFSDDKHLAAAVAKSRQTLLGRKLSIVRSDPKQKKRDGQAPPKDEAHHRDQSRKNGESASEVPASTTKESETSQALPRPSSRKRDDNIQLKGKNTFAMPRNVVRPLGWQANKPKTSEEGDEEPKSNEEFRKLFMKMA